MNLLLTRVQVQSDLISFLPLRIGRSVIFILNAEFELTKEEQALTKKYSFQRASLIHSDTSEDLKRAFTPAWYLGLVVFFFSIIFVKDLPLRGIEGIFIKIAVPPIAAVFSVIILTTIYFFALRKNVTVDQMLNGGRPFYCHSVVDLDDHEKEIKDLAKRFHATLEKAKNWGGRELNPIPEGEILYLSDDEYQSRKSMVESTFEVAGKAVGSVIGAVKKQTESFSDKPEVSPTEPKASNDQKPQRPQSEQAQTASSYTAQTTNPRQPQSTFQDATENSSPPRPHPLAPRPPDKGNE